MPESDVSIKSLLDVMKDEIVQFRSETKNSFHALEARFLLKIESVNLYELRAVAIQFVLISL